MFFRPRHVYNNIRISVQKEILQVSTQRLSTIMLPNDILIKTHFTLTGTLPDSTLLGILPQPMGLSVHPGYTSIGVVAAIGSAHCGLALHDILLMPATYTTYQLCNSEDLNTLSQTLLCHISIEYDPVTVLFAPLISLCMQIAQQIREETCNVTLFGHGLLGNLLLRILKHYLPTVYITVYIDADDIKHDDLYRSGANQILHMSQVQDTMANISQTTILLSSNPWCLEMAQHKLMPGGTLISALATGRCYSKPHQPSCLRHDAIQEALDLLVLGEIEVKDLIAEHIHAEDASVTYQSILMNQYYGRAIVYDW